MKQVILLNANEDTHRVEEEEKMRFLQGLLQQMGVSVFEIWKEELILDVDGRRELRNVLSKFNIHVADDLAGNLEVWVKGSKAGEWRKCSYILKEDLREKDRRKRFYLEMHTDSWSLFDNENL